MLDVLTVLVEASDDPHGFSIAKATKRPTGSVYPILARLEDAGWVESYWEAEHPDQGRPRRRFYRLTHPEGLRAARTLLAERRAKANALSPATTGLPGLAGGPA
jgi:DNA-binding PadR family transcriptional regulator